MNATLHIAEHTAHLNRLNELNNLTLSEPTPAAELNGRIGHGHRLIATDSLGRIVGFANAMHWDGDTPGKFKLTLAVDPAARQAGVGRALYEATERHVREQGGSSLVAEVREADQAGVAFARKQGFALSRHYFQSRLDLADFSATRFAPDVEAVRARGIRFFILADERTEAVDRDLYRIACEGQADIPGNSDHEEPPFEQWRNMVLNGGWLPLNGFLLAADGDRVVGFTCLDKVLPSGGVYNRLTAIDRPYRKRGIALALKVLLAPVAQGFGATYMFTDNDSENAPMIAVNRKLGYTDVPGSYIMVKSL